MLAAFCSAGFAVAPPKVAFGQLLDPVWSLQTLFGTQGHKEFQFALAKKRKKRQNSEAEIGFIFEHQKGGTPNGHTTVCDVSASPLFGGQN